MEEDSNIRSSSVGSEGEGAYSDGGSNAGATPLQSGDDGEYDSGDVFSEQTPDSSDAGVSARLHDVFGHVAPDAIFAIVCAWQMILSHCRQSRYFFENGLEVGVCGAKRYIADKSFIVQFTADDKLVIGSAFAGFIIVGLVAAAITHLQRCV